MELKLHDNSKLAFTWIKPDLLNVELWKPGHLKDGHGWLLRGSALLAGKKVEQFLDFLTTKRKEIAT